MNTHMLIIAAVAAFLIGLLLRQNFRRKESATRVLACIQEHLSVQDHISSYESEGLVFSTSFLIDEVCAEIFEATKNSRPPEGFKLTDRPGLQTAVFWIQYENMHHKITVDQNKECHLTGIHEYVILCW